MTDLREYSDAELSLVVMNDEDLYRMMRRTYNNRALREQLEEIYLFTEEQWDDLVETVEADRAEDEEAN